MATFVARHDIECVYPVSGQYGHTPRALYYVLLAAVVMIRRHVWLAAGAAASVMVYGGTAAIHALILSSINSSSMPLLPSSNVSFAQDSSVWINGLVLDLDMDATLAVVGAGFLMLLPFSVLSTTFKRSEAKAILIAWGLLMLMGMVCCLASLYTVNATPDGPFHQFRFCAADHIDFLPISSPSGGLAADWNTTVWNYFNATHTAPSTCFYPCYHSSQVLRSQSDIEVIAFPHLPPSGSRYKAFKILAALVYACVPLNILTGLCLFSLQTVGNHRPSQFLNLRSIQNSMDSLTESPLTKFSIVYFLLVVTQVYALIFAPVMVAVFIVFAEFSLSLDPESESIRHVGQWQPLVAVTLILIAALLGKYSDKFKTYLSRNRGVDSVERSTQVCME
jgi:hypothetical protein